MLLLVEYSRHAPLFPALLLLLVPLVLVLLPLLLLWGCYPERVLSGSREELGSCGKSAHKLALRHAYATRGDSVLRCVGEIPDFLSTGDFTSTFPNVETARRATDTFPSQDAASPRLEILLPLFNPADSVRAGTRLEKLHALRVVVF